MKKLSIYILAAVMIFSLVSVVSAEDGKGGGAVSDHGHTEARPKDSARLPSKEVAIEDRRLSRAQARIP